jgi:hypothetical protein
MENTMPKEELKTGNDKKMEFYGMDQVPAVFVDGHIVAKAGSAYTVYFFQSQLPDPIGSDEGQVTYGTRHKCVGRIVLANDDSFDKFLVALAKNRGATIEFPSASKPQKEGQPT